MRPLEEPIEACKIEKFVIPSETRNLLFIYATRDCFVASRRAMTG